MTDDTDKVLRQILDDVRIEAEPLVIAELNADMIANHSADAAMVFLPFRLRGNQPVDLFGEPLNQIVSRLPITALVMAAEDIDLDAEPEEGKAGETAEALDTLMDAEKRARDLEKEAAKATEAAIAAKDKFRQMQEEAEKSAVGESEIKELKVSMEEAEKLSEKATRRSAKAKAKAEAAAQAAEDLGVKTEKEETGKTD
jgi:hypothetical protein